MADICHDTDAESVLLMLSGHMPTKARGPPSCLGLQQAFTFRLGGKSLLQFNS